LNIGLKLASATREWSNRKLILAAVVFVFVIWLGLVASIVPPESWPFLAEIMHGEFKGGAARPNRSAPSPPLRSSPEASSATSSADTAEEPPKLPTNALRPSPVVTRNTRASAPDGVLMDNTTENTRPSERAIPQEPNLAAALVANTPAPAADLTSPRRQTTIEVATAPPLDIVPADGNAVLKGVLSPVTASPVLPELKSSSGISGGTIERFVKPTYPPEALRLRRTGRVVLQAVITKEGTVKEVKVIDGDSLLARAAIDAVAEWRYQPYMLNGQPTQTTMRITIVFNLP
jgi:TonB family protein